MLPMFSSANRSTFWKLLISSFLLIGLFGIIYSSRSTRDSQAARQHEISGLITEASPSDWPHIRGANYDGVSPAKDLVNSWPSAGPPILWTREIGQGYSSFAVAGGKVFTQRQSLTEQTVICLDGDTGATVWEHRYDWPYQPASVYPGPYATPTWHQGKVYFASPDGLVGCLDDRNGHLLWSVNVLKKFKGKGTEFGYACSPLVEDRKVILPVGGPGASVVALSALDGSTVWQAGDDDASYCPAYPITLGGRRVIVAFLRNVLAGYDMQSGEQLWRETFSREYDEHSAWPIYSEPYLMVSSPFKAGAQLFRLDPDTKKLSSGPVWLSRELSNDIFSSVLYQGHVYGFDIKEYQAKSHRTSRGEFKCLDFNTGKVRWSTSKVGHATVLIADNKLIMFNDTGALILAQANPDRYEELARAQILGGGLCWTQPALANNKLYVRDQARAVCVYLGNPELLSPEQLQHATVAADLPTTIHPNWSALFPHEPEFPFDAPRREELTHWYFFSLVGVLGCSFLIAFLWQFLARPIPRNATGLWNGTTFWLVAFLGGIAGTAVFSHWRDTLIFTWPVSLFAAFQILVISITWAERQTEKRNPRWLARLTSVLFLGICLGYYELCKRVGVIIGWGFLIGFLPGWPLAALAAKCQLKQSKMGVQMLLNCAAFTAYFWGAGLFTMWKMR